MAHQGFVYILASRRNGTLYTGVTGDLVKRVWQHREGLVEGFTKRYRVHRLVYYEVHDGIAAAIQRETQIKRWNREWKLELIEQENPMWRDLYQEMLAGGEGATEGSALDYPGFPLSRE